MHKMNSEHANRARKALAAYNFDPNQELQESVKEALVNLGHLCDAENIDFLASLKRAIRHWQVERVDPTSVLDGPVVEIIIGEEGLPPNPKLIKRPSKQDKSRPA
jgi:hypothetical protein